jgi:hypothetical protein
MVIVGIVAVLSDLGEVKAKAGNREERRNETKRSGKIQDVDYCNVISILTHMQNVMWLVIQI